MAPVENRLTMLETGSTSSSGTAGRSAGLELQQPAQGHEVLGLVVHAAGVGLEDVVAALTRGVLQPEDGLRVEQVRFAVAAPLVFAAAEQGLVRLFDAVLGVGHLVAGQRLRPR